MRKVRIALVAVSGISLVGIQTLLNESGLVAGEAEVFSDVYEWEGRVPGQQLDGLLLDDSQLSRADARACG